jgi:hypothetical protein
MHCSYNIKRVSENAVIREQWVKLPYCGCGLNVGDACDNRHNVSDGEVDHVGKTRKMLSSGIEVVYVAAVKQ